MKKASMACLIAGALALPLAAHAQEDKSNTTDPQIGKTPNTSMNRDTAPMNRSDRDATPNRTVGTTASDAALTAKVKTQLIKDRDVSAMNVNVDTMNGVVTLKGNAKSRMEADKAASLARAVDGVKSVKNELVVGAAAGSNTSRGSSTAAERSAPAGNAKGALDNKPTPPKENKNNGERSNSEKTD